MSRHALAPYSPRYEVSIRWDPPLANFFLQVRDSEIDEQAADPVIVWLGADGYATEPAVDPVLEEAARWAGVPQDLRALLLVDQQCEGARPRVSFRQSRT
jgi:hypothetical protein